MGVLEYGLHRQVKHGGNPVGQIQRRIMLIGFYGDNGLTRDTEFSGEVSLSQASLATQRFQMGFHAVRTLLSRTNGQMTAKLIQKIM